MILVALSCARSRASVCLLRFPHLVAEQAAAVEHGRLCDTLLVEGFRSLTPLWEGTETALATKPGGKSAGRS